MPLINIINEFFLASLSCFGSEILLTTNQRFTIEQIIGNNDPYEMDYIIQYGFPNSGGVMLEYAYNSEEDKFYVDGITVFAQPANEQIVMGILSHDTEIKDKKVSIRMGFNTGAKEHTDIKEISSNPNAVKMIQIAANDLKQAQIIGDCEMKVVEGRDSITCCRSKRIEYENGRSL